MAWEKGQLLQSGKYEIVRQIGAGGFGQTYLAADVFLKRQVVIKRPHPALRLEGDYEKYVRRFQREGQVLVQINHPNVVRAIEFFQDEGIPCLVMEYVVGETLNECIRQRKFIPPEEALVCFRQLAKTLDILHQQSLIHCDIHPGNIILRQSREPVLIDFGSAKLLKPHTMTVTTAINESFAPYEQRAGGNPQPTLDVYGLAATLYFVITGQKPQAAIDRKMYGDTLIPPKQHRSDLSDWLNQAIIKGMALEAKDRPSSMQAWADLLQAPQTATKKIKSPKLPSSPTEKSSFPWRFVGSILLGHLPMGILAGFHSNSFAHMTLAMVMVVAWSQAIIMPMDRDAGEKSIQFWFWIIVAGGGAWSLTGVAWAWAWAWAGVWTGTVVISSADKIKADISLYFLMVGALLGGGISGYFTSTGLWWGIAQGLLVNLQLVTAGYSFVNLDNLLRLREPYRKTQVAQITCTLTSLVLISGGCIGWWLKLARTI